jgi:tRNA A-37 threonylcarbamoyl transferase component Bud32
VNAHQSASGLAFDSLLPQREMLLDETQMAQRLSLLLEKYGCASVNRCQRLRTKYRVGVSLRVLHEVSIAGHAYKIAARSFPTDRPATVFAQNNSSCSSVDLVPPTFFDEELSTVFWTFPNDRKLRSLSVLTNVPDDLSRINGSKWTKSNLVAYAPEKSVTAQCLNDQVHILAYAKVYAGDQGRRACAIYQDIYAGVHDSKLRLPRVIGYSETHHTLVLEAISGERLSELDQDRRSNGFFNFGAALADFHGIAPPNPVGTFKRLRPEGLRKAARVVAQCRPDVAWRTSVLAKQLITTMNRAADPQVLLHGDVHPKNGIVTRAGVTLIDLDQAGTGPAAADLGSLLAALEYDQCVGHLTNQQRLSLTESFLNGYASKRQLPSEGSIRWHTAAALLEERALRAVNRIRLEGLSHMDELLEVASNILNRAAH